MIQRKQSIWLLLASLFNACVFFFAAYRYEVSVNGVIEQKELLVPNHYPSLLIALVMTVIPFITIFMFNNRKRQVRMSVMGIVSTLSFVSLMLVRVGKLSVEPLVAGTGSYWVSSVLPVAAIILMIMAIAGIRADEKLVRSVDRLR